MPTKAKEDFLSSFYADDTAYAASDTSRRNQRSFAGDCLQTTLIQLESFCAKWRIGLNASKTKLLLFKMDKTNAKHITTPNIYLRNELIEYEESVKFLGILFDRKLTFEEHIKDIVKRAFKRINLLKALKGRDWGASSEIILYTYRTYVRPLLEYSCILFAHAKSS